MHQKYLLYIDILGFSELVKSSPSAVKNLYRIIDTLNVHQHDGFRTIIFSDTILVYNDFELRTEHDHAYAVMFSCEFAQDLLIRLVGTGVFFRAILEYGDFSHDALGNIQSFFGSALVEAYSREKLIQAVGLFATDRCIARNRVFPSERFSDDLHFVYLHQSLERLQQNTGGSLPSDPVLVVSTDDYHDILWDLSFLGSVFKNMREHPDQRVRGKHLATYDLYRRKYPELLAAFEASGFQPECICPSVDWSSRKARFKSATAPTPA